MGFFDSFALVGLFLIGLPLASPLGWLLAKIFRAPGLARLMPALLLGVIVAGYPLALRFFGEPGRGRVIERHETVRVSSRGGGVTHHYGFAVRYLPRHAERADVTARDPRSDSVTISMSASRAMFERTPAGTRVARIDGATRTFDATNLRDRRTTASIVIAIFAALVLFGVFRGRRRARSARAATR